MTEKFVDHHSSHFYRTKRFDVHCHTSIIFQCSNWGEKGNARWLVRTTCMYRVRLLFASFGSKIRFSRPAGNGGTATGIGEGAATRRGWRNRIATKLFRTSFRPFICYTRDSILFPIYGEHDIPRENTKSFPCFLSSLSLSLSLSCFFVFYSLVLPTGGEERKPRECLRDSFRTIDVCISRIPDTNVARDEESLSSPSETRRNMRDKKRETCRLRGFAFHCCCEFLFCFSLSLSLCRWGKFVRVSFEVPERLCFFCREVVGIREIWKRSSRGSHSTAHLITSFGIK